MKAITNAAFGALSLLLFASSTHAQSSTTTGLKPITTLGCYKSVAPLTEFQEYDFQTSGWCQSQCGSQGHPVMAITAGSTCYCGDELPALDQQISNSSCNSPCNGFGQQTCGGLSAWQLYLTGLTTSVQTAPNSTQSDNGKPTTSSATPSVVTQAGAVTTVTQSSSPNSGSSSTSKIGIAVGVVVGLIAVAAIIGALVFYLRSRRRRAIEEEHRRNAAISSFVQTTSETSSTTDRRLDPSVFNHRRESVGSIADELDYSRKILTVRNPDYRASGASNFA